MMMPTVVALVLLGSAVVSAVVREAGQARSSPGVERKSCTAPDGVRIVYSRAGAGRTALVFIHGGMANRTFFDGQLATLSSRYRVVAVDLAGHGESGRNRTKWGIAEFGADVKAVLDAEGLGRVILFGNSLGGPTAVEAALLVPGRVIGVVGIDTFQDLGHPETAEYARAAADDARRRVEAFRTDYAGSMRAMMRALFHPDADPAVVADAERRMLETPVEVAVGMLRGVAGYDAAASVRRLAVPLCAINGDRYPTDVAAARSVKPDFDAIIMTHVGHYPMLERASEFNRHVLSVADSLSTR